MTITVKKNAKIPGYLADTISSLNKKKHFDETKNSNSNTRNLTIIRHIRKIYGYLSHTISSLNKKKHFDEINHINSNTRFLTIRKESNKIEKKSSKIENNKIYHDPYGHFNTNNKTIDPYKFFLK